MQEEAQQEPIEKEAAEEVVVAQYPTPTENIQQTVHQESDQQEQAEEKQDVQQQVAAVKESVQRPSQSQHRGKNA